MKQVKIAIVEDDPVVRYLLHHHLDQQPGFRCVLVCGSAEQLLAELPQAIAPDLILLDIGLPGLSGLEALPLIKQQLPDVEVILQTIFEDPDRIYQALCLGATGYVLKNTPLPQLCQAIHDVAAGGSALSPSVARRMLAHFKPATATTTANSAQLTPREQDVLRALVDGLSDKEIAQRLNLGTETVRGYVKTIYRKLQVTGRVELLSRAAKGL